MIEIINAALKHNLINQNTFYLKTKGERYLNRVILKNNEKFNYI